MNFTVTHRFKYNQYQLTLLKKMPKTQQEFEALYGNSISDILPNDTLLINNNKFKTREYLGKIPQFKNVNILSVYITAGFWDYPRYQFLQGFTNVTRLTIVELGDYLPVEICQMSQLRHLTIEEDSLDSAPNHLSYLKNLETIAFNNSSLSTPPYSLIASMEKLYSLYLKRKKRVYTNMTIDGWLYDSYIEFESPSSELSDRRDIILDILVGNEKHKLSTLQLFPQTFIGDFGWKAIFIRRPPLSRSTSRSRSRSTYQSPSRTTYQSPSQTPSRSRSRTPPRSHPRSTSCR